MPEGDPPRSRRLRLVAVPNPSAGSVQIWLDLVGPTSVRAVVVDAEGRMVRRLEDVDVPAGRVAILWDGRDDRGHAMPCGSYWVRVRTEEGERALRLTLIR